MKEYSATISKEGRVIIPAAVRRALGFQASDALTLVVKDGELRLLRRQDALRNMQQRLRPLRDPAKPAVDELLAERRAEAARE